MKWKFAGDRVDRDYILQRLTPEEYLAARKLTIEQAWPEDLPPVKGPDAVKIAAFAEFLRHAGPPAPFPLEKEPE